MTAIEPTDEQRQAARKFFYSADNCDDHSDIAQLLAEREHALREQVATLTKERDEARALVLSSEKQAVSLSLKCAQHLVDIATLRSFADGVLSNYDCDSDAHRYNTACRCCDAAKVLAATAHCDKPSKA